MAFLRALLAAAATLVAEALRHATLQQSSVKLAPLADGLRVTRHVERGPKGEPLVTTGDGTIVGEDENGTVAFKNIKYGVIPERFSPSVEPKPWAPEVKDGRKFGVACIGARTGGVRESEDCLTLNIWVPNGVHADLPVRVFIHGGMLETGSAAGFSGAGSASLETYPTIFINMNFRIGIMGCIAGREEDGIYPNLWLHDQQQGLRWIQRNVRFFGGDPSRVALEGASEGCSLILAHMVAPGSKGLFSRVIFRSPVDDIWAKNINQHRTDFIVNRTQCARPTPRETLACLRSASAQALSGADFFTGGLAHGFPVQSLWSLYKWIDAGSSRTLPGIAVELGWHPVIDGRTLPGEPRELIAQGRWHKVPVLITMTKNESSGVIPTKWLRPEDVFIPVLRTLKRPSTAEQVVSDYNGTLVESGCPPDTSSSMMHMMMTDIMWTCNVRALAEDIVQTGGQAYIGMLWFGPAHDPVPDRGSRCRKKGAMCHGDDNIYSKPSAGWTTRVPVSEDDRREQKYRRQYQEQLLAFVRGASHKIAPYDLATETMTFMEEGGLRNVPFWRQQQCNILDMSVNEKLSAHHQRRSQVLAAKRLGRKVRLAAGAR